MSSSTGFTATDMIASASQVLTAGGYQQIVGRFPQWETPTSRLFEDPYNVVGIVVFDTCSELIRAWAELQDSLVTVISKYVGQGEGKSWDGYLVLLTPGFAPLESADIESVRYNTTRLRKLVATGDDLPDLLAVDRVLRSLLPIGKEQTQLKQESSLDLLPELLSKQGIPKEITRIIVDAFRDQSPLLEKLHNQEAAR